MNLRLRATAPETSPADWLRFSIDLRRDDSLMLELCTKFGSHISYSPWDRDTSVPDVTRINFRFLFLVTWSLRIAAMHLPGKGEFLPPQWLDICTTKQLSVIFEFYFQFRFRPHHRTRHVISHLDAKFHPNRTILSRDMMLYRFSRWGCCDAILLPVSNWMTSLSSEDPCLSANQIYSYNSIRSWDITISCLEMQTSATLEFYFRFRFWPYYRSWHAPVCQISSKSDCPRHKNEIMSIFKMADLRHLKFYGSNNGFFEKLM